MLKEMFLLLVGSGPIFAALNPLGFSLACLGGVALAVLLWWLCSVYTRLWNLSFYLNWFHLLLCGIAALLTIFLVITFVSVGEIGRGFDQAVTEWGAQLHSLPVNMDGEVNNLNSANLRSQFEAAHPFLRDVVASDQNASSEITVIQYADSADSGAESTQSGGTINEAVYDLKYLLQLHVHWAVYRLRALLLLALLLVQGTVFAITGYAAHRGICPSI